MSIASVQTGFVGSSLFMSCFTHPHHRVPTRLSDIVLLQVDIDLVQVYLDHKKQCPMVALREGAVSYERGTPVQVKRLAGTHPDRFSPQL